MTSADQTTPSTEDAAPGLSRPAHVVIVQPGLSAYRVPVFRELARRRNVLLRVVHGDGMGVPNAPAEGFEAEERPLKRWSVAAHPLYWQEAHLSELRPPTDVMIASWDVHYLSLIPSLRKARRRRIPIILWGHGYSKRESTPRRRLRMWLGRQADAVLLYNRAGAEAAVAGGIEASRVFVALNTIDISAASAARRRWLGEPGRLDAWGRDHGLTPGSSPVLLHVARYSPERRIDLLLEAAQMLRRELPDLKLVLVGNGYDGPEVRTMIERAGLADVVITPGPIYDEELLAPWFLTARAMAFPADIGLSLHHAFAYGLPVVTHGDRAAQAPELEALVDGVNGLLYRRDDAGDLADKLRRLLADPGLAARLGEAARRTIEGQFTLRRMVDGFVEAINFCLSGRSPAQSPDEPV